MKLLHQEFLRFQERFQTRRVAILVDDSTPTFRAVLIASANDITPSLINEILHMSGGVLFVALSAARAEALMLLPLPERRIAGTREAVRAFVSVEARQGVTTGISAADRAHTIRILASESPQPRSLVRPGHIFPVAVSEGGTLVRNALPEGAFDVGRICCGAHAVAFCEMLSSSGSLVSRDECLATAERAAIPMLSLSELVSFRLQSEQLVFRVAQASIPTAVAGELLAIVYRSTVHDGEHVALVKGELKGDSPVLTRVQRERTLSDVFGGTPARSREQLHYALQRIGERGRGVVVHLRSNDAVSLADELNAPPEGAAEPNRAALMRGYGLGAQILRDLGVQRIELLTGSPKRLAGLQAFGIDIVKQHQIPMSDLT